jgi:hypothetical protein
MLSLPGIDTFNFFSENSHLVTPATPTKVFELRLI